MTFETKGGDGKKPRGWSFSQSKGKYVLHSPSGSHIGIEESDMPVFMSMINEMACITCLRETISCVVW